MIKLMLITGDPQLAAWAASAGVDRIFVDLEHIGKDERQGHLDTLISRHSMEDVASVRRAAPGVELLVRLNPLFEGTGGEINEALSNGAEALVLPMFKTADEVRRFTGLVARRARVIPLVETESAMLALGEIVKVPGISELYIGLNDLHLDLGMDFMFEPLANGMVDAMAAIIKGSGLSFGFGGIARVGEGLLPGEMVLGEHLRLGSSSVILSRTFMHGDREGNPIGESKLRYEVGKLREIESDLSGRGSDMIALDHEKVVDIVSLVARAARKKKKP